MEDQYAGEGIYSDDDSKSEDESNENGCLNIRLIKEEKQRIIAPWLKSLVLKVLGRRFGFKFLERRIIQLWNPKGTVSLADLGNDYYLAQLNNDEDYNVALFGGP